LVLATKFHVGIEKCFLGNSETSKANILCAQQRKKVLFAGPVLDIECCYPLKTQSNLDARKYPALRVLV
jgi:hypothetical protein